MDERTRMASVLELLVVITGILLMGVPVAIAQNGVDLEACEEAGLAAGAAAARGACAALQLECPPPAFELRSSFPNSLPEVLFTEVLRGSCTLIFQTSCKLAAAGAIFNSPEHQACQNILSYEPGDDAPKSCPDLDTALQIYSRYADRICNQELDAAPIPSPGLEPRPSPKPAKSPPPPETTEEMEPLKEELVSMDRQTFQSTTGYGAFSSRAIDRNDASCTHTGYSYKKRDELTTDPWWTVDLGATRKVTRIQITNRKDCCGDRLTDFEIRIGDVSPLGDGIGDPATQNPLCQAGLTVKEGVTEEFACPMRGRFVTIRIPGDDKVLTLCDVKVFAEADENIVITEEKLLSAEKPTFQSSTLWNGRSGRATDGNIDGVYNNGGCTHTGMSPRMQKTSNPWWTVDLGSTKKVSSVRITTRSDCCSDWLNDFEIRVGDGRPQGNGGQNPICRQNLSIPRGETYQFDCPAKGRYVTIRIPGDGKILVLCEVEVLG